MCWGFYIDIDGKYRKVYTLGDLKMLCEAYTYPFKGILDPALDPDPEDEDDEDCLCGTDRNKIGELLGLVIISELHGQNEESRINEEMRSTGKMIMENIDSFKESEFKSNGKNIVVGWL